MSPTSRLKRPAVSHASSDPRPDNLTPSAPRGRGGLVRRLPVARGWVGALLSLSAVSACAPGKLALRPELTPEAQSVSVYFPGTTVPCEPYVDLGIVQGVAGEEPLPGKPVTEPATLEMSLDWLRHQAHQRGATGVLLLDMRQSATTAVFVTTGVALRCPHNEHDTPPE